MRMVLRNQNSRCRDFRNRERAFRRAERGGENKVPCAGLSLRPAGLFEDAVVELLALPVGGGLDEGQDYGMRILLRGKELGLE